MTKLFSDFDFSELDNPEFKEDAVREELIAQLLKELGYSYKSKHRIIRSKTVEHPFVKTGSGQRRKIKSIPDYLLQVDGKNAWVLDAKAPDENITSGDHPEQVYFYAIHPEIRVPIYALCNGREFIAFATNQEAALIHFPMHEIEKHWNSLTNLLATENAVQHIPEPQPGVEKPFDYTDRVPPKRMEVIQKQSAARHFGVHGYFTKQPYLVVQEYITRFTKPGDLVLDPFGGSGVTAVEALVLGRKAIHIDLNPLSVFITKNLILPVNLGDLYSAYLSIETEFTKHCPSTKTEIEKALATYPYPHDMKLMRDADVDSIEKLFTPKQLAQLAYLKHLITNLKDKAVKGNLMLAFSSTLTKINRTYHPSTTRGDNAGDSAAFRYYRFRIAPNPVELDVMATFRTKVKKVIAAKKELAAKVTPKGATGNVEVYKGTATDLKKVADESVDYIYTDPPYGAKIPYLDLSVMWNGWLDLPVTKTDYDLEAIEGGEHAKTKADYAELIAESIREMYRVLKFDRWMSFVFNHKDPAYWYLIVNTAEDVGFEYAGAVEQTAGQASFKKRQNPFTVLRGQLIINFKKIANPVALAKYNLGVNVTKIIAQTVEGLIAREHGATIDQINSEMTLMGLEMGFLDVLSKHYQDLTPFLQENFDYDADTHKYHLRKNTKFKTSIPLDLRVRYYVYSYLKRMQLQKTDPTIDEIVLYIMPLLKNGTTPKKETILAVVEQIAQRVGEDRWRLSEQQQQGHLWDAV